MNSAIESLQWISARILTQSARNADATETKGAAISVGLTTEYGHNAWCNPSGVVDETRSYAPAAQAPSVVETKGYDDFLRLINTSSTYDVLNQVVSIQNSGVMDATYQYDDNSNKTFETFSGVMADWSWQTKTAITEGYTPEDEFIHFNRPSQSSYFSFARSAIGNISNVNDNGVSRPRGYSSVHELTSVDTQPQTFNDDGNLTLSNRGLELTWGDDGRLTKAVAPPSLANLYTQNVTEDLETDYGYDTLNQRVWMHSRESGVTRTHRLFIYAGSNCIAEYNIGAEADSPANEYVYANSIDSLVLIRRGNSQRLIPIRNQQWSVTALIDADTGGVLERYAYDVFGERIILAPNATSIRKKSWYGNQYGYTSRRHDAETGSMYFRARYFEPTTGEFNSQDPLEYADGMSLYRGYFVPEGVDPSGLKIDRFIGCNAAQKTAITAADNAVTNRLVFLITEIDNLKKVGAKKIIKNYLKEHGLEIEKTKRYYGRGAYTQLQDATNRLDTFLDELKDRINSLDKTVNGGYNADCCSCSDQYDAGDDIPPAYVSNWDFLWSGKVNFCTNYFELPATSRGGVFTSPAINQASILLHELSHLSFWTTDDSFKYLDGITEQWRGEFLDELVDDAYFYQNLQDRSISYTLDPGSFKADGHLFLKRGTLFYLLVPGISQNQGPEE